MTRWDEPVSLTSCLWRLGISVFVLGVVVGMILGRAVQW